MFQQKTEAILAALQNHSESLDWYFQHDVMDMLVFHLQATVRATQRAFPNAARNERAAAAQMHRHSTTSYALLPSVIQRIPKLECFAGEEEHYINSPDASPF
ncbi:MAG: hypothetical protein Q7T55_11125 [Solirubrobacteraceae bacterium]|nr:hypothetical protein [Solirubrobacteraceae bacterium]